MISLKKSKPIKIIPEQGQESVWDYPRPPVLERSHKQRSNTKNGLRR